MGPPAERRTLDALMAREGSLRAANVRAFLVECGAAARCREVVGRFLADARKALLGLGTPGGTGSLLALTHFLEAQTGGLAAP
jgi:hypothetical protein